ncbi:predicted protein [Nematostella vectensis]|uniref:EF-hand domain-containing protein n=3 Tax=Nematostella vectensis TaxID=45351 RepID=A7RUF2_NEMVE|nr:predicted protein [Nematostella vectensis]|eukprot:XP_001636954.1 predicted protein [Nematostella vectensis]
MRNAFDIFDRNKDGTIDHTEFGRVLQAIGYTPTISQILDILNAFDKNGDGAIDFDEFVTMSRYFRGRGAEKLEENLRQAFRVFDRNGDGYISAEELRVAVTTLGDALTQDEAEELIGMLDQDGDGKLGYEEFVVIAKKSLKECIKALEHRGGESGLIQLSH